MEDKIRRREENPDAEVEAAAAAREVTVFFDSSVAGARPGWLERLLLLQPPPPPLLPPLPSLAPQLPQAQERARVSHAGRAAGVGSWLMFTPRAPASLPPPLHADGMPWRFRPTQRSVRLHPGQSTLAFYTAHNKSDKAITGGWVGGWVGGQGCAGSWGCRGEGRPGLAATLPAPKTKGLAAPARALPPAPPPGVSTYNVAPQQAGQYFNKIQCFCFEVS